MFPSCSSYIWLCWSPSSFQKKIYIKIYIYTLSFWPCPLAEILPKKHNPHFPFEKCSQVSAKIKTIPIFFYKNLKLLLFFFKTWTWQGYLPLWCPRSQRILGTILIFWWTCSFLFLQKLRDFATFMT